MMRRRVQMVVVFKGPIDGFATREWVQVTTVSGRTYDEAILKAERVKGHVSHGPLCITKRRGIRCFTSSAGLWPAYTAEQK